MIIFLKAYLIVMLLAFVMTYIVLREEEELTKGQLILAIVGTALFPLFLLTIILSFWQQRNHQQIIERDKN